MGVSRSPGELATKLIRHADATERANKAAVTAIALQAKTEIHARMVTATGGDLRLSGLGRGRARTARRVRGASGKVGVRYDEGRESRRENPVMVVRATGPAHLVERDVRPHAIVPKASTGVAAQRLRYRKDGRIAPGRTRSTRRAALLAVAAGDTSGVRGVLKFSNGVYRRYTLRHPGSKGREPFAKGAEAAEAAGSGIFSSKHRQELVRSFGLG